jgi:vacuolar-type H+-ATPase subunit C/Vma6
MNGINFLILYYADLNVLLNSLHDEIIRPMQIVVMYSSDRYNVKIIMNTQKHNYRSRKLFYNHYYSYFLFPLN